MAGGCGYRNKTVFLALRKLRSVDEVAYQASAIIMCDNHHGGEGTERRHGISQ